ncbi:MAG: SPOR domain-containing protein [Bacteroidales bacterium]|nr:SPOR domain-containing protein [Bacteroidales bacterium]
MKKLLLIVILSVFAIGGFAQNKGSLHINQDSRVERLMKRQRDVYAVSNTMSGFRVQIFMEVGNEAVDHAEVVKKDFTEIFPELPIYLSYEQPFYRLRVGDFRNRIEAEKYLRLIKPQFNLAFVTADVINPPARIEPIEIEEEQDQGEENGENFQE